MINLCSRKHLLTELKTVFPYIPEDKIARTLTETLNSCIRLNVIVADNQEGSALYRYISKEEDCSARVILKSALPSNTFARTTVKPLPSVETLPGTSVMSIAGTSTDPPEQIQPRMTRSKSQLQAHHKFDLIVIGGGSGGLACAQEASKYGASIALLDYVTPSPKGSFWGLGGTCVNVGCIPKKLIHEAALLGESIKDSIKYGWKIRKQQTIPAEEEPLPPEEEPLPPEEENIKISHRWNILIEAVQNHIKSLNWSIKNQLKERHITYYNGHAKFVNSRTLKVTMKDGECSVTGKKIVIAIGTRPKYPDIPGAGEYGLTSDDIFSLKKAPGKTLIVGAGYIGLECAGFLNGLGYEVTVMVRSSPLHRFDCQMGEIVVNEMKLKKVEFLMKCMPISLEETEDSKLSVSWINTTDQSRHSDIFETVLFAIGRRAHTQELGVNVAGINTIDETGKIVDNNEQTNVDHIYAVGDVLHGKPELTPVAIQAGKLLAQRLFNNGREQMDYDNVATTVWINNGVSPKHYRRPSHGS